MTICYLAASGCLLWELVAQRAFWHDQWAQLIVRRRTTTDQEQLVGISNDLDMLDLHGPCGAASFVLPTICCCFSKLCCFFFYTLHRKDVCLPLGEWWHECGQAVSYPNEEVRCWKCLGTCRLWLLPSTSLTFETMYIWIGSSFLADRLFYDFVCLSDGQS